MNPELIHITIIEDNKYMREGWKTFMEIEPDMHIAGTFNCCEAAFKSGVLDRTDLIIMDIGLPGMSGIEGVEIVRRDYPEIVTLMATVYDDDKHIFEALKAGAVGYLMKKISPDEMIEAIRSAMDGGSPITPNIARKIINIFQTRQVDKSELTQRETEILQQLATGLSYGEIGKKLHLSIDGIRYHVRNIYEKLQVHSRSEAVSKGLYQRLISQDFGKEN